MTLVTASARGDAAQLSGVADLHPSLEGDVIARRGVDLGIATGEAAILLGPSIGAHRRCRRWLAGQSPHHMRPFRSSGDVGEDGRQGDLPMSRRDDGRADGDRIQVGQACTRAVRLFAGLSCGHWASQRRFAVTQGPGIVFSSWR